MAMNLKLLFLVCLSVFLICADPFVGARRFHVEVSDVNANPPSSSPESACINDCAIAVQRHGEQSGGKANPPSPVPESFNTDMYTFSVSEPARLSIYHPVSEPALPDELRPVVAQTGKWLGAPDIPRFPQGFPFTPFLPPFRGTAKLDSDQP